MVICSHYNTEEELKMKTYFRWCLIFSLALIFVSILTISSYAQNYSFSNLERQLGIYAGSNYANYSITNIPEGKVIEATVVDPSKIGGCLKGDRVKLMNLGYGEWTITRLEDGSSVHFVVQKVAGNIMVTKTDTIVGTTAPGGTVAPTYSKDFEGRSGGPYITARVGGCFLNDSTLSEEGFPITVDTEFDTGMLFEGAVGYEFAGPFRIEGEVGYRKNDLDKFTALGYSVAGGGDVDTLSFMLNGYVEIENQSSITPFLGAGIGYAKVSANDISIPGVITVGSEDDSVFAYQFVAGIGFSATKNLIIDLAYKYFATDDPEFQYIKAEYGSHNITIGFRYVF